jgi:Nuclease-related domain
MANSRPWPLDDDDRPSGSVRPLSHADLQAILAHLNSDDPDELLASTDADRPIAAMQVRASVGRPGGAAQARWRQLRAAEWAAWTRTLPWRAAATLGIGAAGGQLGYLLAPRLGLVLGVLAAVVAGWRLRFRPSPEAVAWRRGAAGERCTARLLDPLERHGWAVLHDLAVPGSAANLDHLAIGPGGVFVIDSKQYRGRLRLDAVGKLWHGRYPLAPILRTVSWEADQAAQVLPDPGMAVVPIVAVHGAQVPRGKVVTQGVPVVSPGACPACFASSQRCSGPSGSPGWSTGPGCASTPPANRYGRPSPRPLPWQSRLNQGPSWLHGEGGLGEDPRFERGVVGGDELDLDQVLARGEVGESFVEAVVHGHQFAVDQQVDVALVGSDPRGGVGDDPGPGQIEADFGGLPADGLAVAGGQDAELGGRGGPGRQGGRGRR